MKKQAQLELKLEAANREWDQMMADLNYKAEQPQITEPSKPTVYVFDVLFNGRVKHRFYDIDKSKAFEKAQNRAKFGASKGWPTSVRASQ